MPTDLQFKELQAKVAVLTTQNGNLQKLAKANARLNKEIASIINGQGELLVAHRTELDDLKTKSVILDARLKSIETKLPEEDIKP